MPITLTARERDTVLAALRAWQRTPVPERDFQCYLIASEHDSPLRIREIDTLCEKINQ